MLNQIRAYLQPLSPSIWAFILLGYAPFLGESFRFYVLPFSGFILVAVIFTLAHLKQFKNFILEKNAILYIWLAITSYCLIGVLWHWGQYPWYQVYLDLGPFLVMVFGLFFASYLSTRITFEQLLFVFGIILALLFLKTTYIIAYQVAIPGDGTGFFIGGGGGIGGGFPRIILRGENPFLMSMFVMLASSLALNKHLLSKTIGLVLSLVITSSLIALSGWRSIYFALAPIMLALLVICAFKKRALNKVILLGTVFTLFCLSVTFLMGRDSATAEGMVAMTQAAGMELIARSSAPLLNAQTLSIMGSNQIPLLNSQSVALKIGEYVQITNLVADHYLVGLGVGFNYLSPGRPEAIGNYVHSQPFWLYLKGGLILLTLFYGFIVCALVKKYQAWLADSQNQSILVSTLILISLCSMDALTNQFPTLAGSFYLGFWAIWMQKSTQIPANDQNRSNLGSSIG
jgi:hypothetical protein